MIPMQDVVDLGATAGLRAVEISAVILSALSGIIVASRKRMDLVGTYALAVVLHSAAAPFATFCSIADRSFGSPTGSTSSLYSRYAS